MQRLPLVLLLAGLLSGGSAAQEAHLVAPRRGHQLTPVGDSLWVTGGKSYPSHFLGWGRDGYAPHSTYPGIERFDPATGESQLLSLSPGRPYAYAAAFPGPPGRETLYLAGKDLLARLELPSSPTGSPRLVPLPTPEPSRNVEDADWCPIQVAGRDRVLLTARDRLALFDRESERFLTSPEVPEAYPGEARRGVACASLDGRLYLFGGELPGGPASREAWVLQPGPGARWLPLPDLPLGLNGARATAVGERIVLVGGRGVGVYHASVLAFTPGASPGEGRWASLPDLPRGTCKHAIALDERTLWVSTGYAWGTREEGRYGFRMHPGTVFPIRPDTAALGPPIPEARFLPGDPPNLTWNFSHPDRLTGEDQTLSLTWMALHQENQGEVRVQAAGRAPFVVPAEASDVRQGSEVARYLRAEVEGLPPGSKVSYQARERGPRPRVLPGTLRTQPADPRVFTFAAYGDSKAQYDVCHELNAALTDDLGEDRSWFVVQGGDFGAEANFREWQAWVHYSPHPSPSRTAKLLASRVFLPVHGNHEHLAPSWFAQFAAPHRASRGMPPLGNAGAEGRWYSFDYGPVHFVVLTSGEYQDQEWYGRQLDWLEADLAADRARRGRGPTRWTVVAVHHTLFTSGEHFEDLADYGLHPGARRPLVKLLEESQVVDLVIAGHDHDYERSKQIRGFRARQAPDGHWRYQRDPDAFVDEDSGRFGHCRQGRGTIYLTLGGAGASQRDMRPRQELGDASWIAWRKPDPGRGEQATTHPCYHYARVRVSPQILSVEVVERDMAHLPAHAGRDDGVNGIIDSVRILAQPRSRSAQRERSGW